MENDKDTCKGCLEPKEPGYCTLKLLGCSIGCPCQNCLVKTQCSKACAEYREYLFSSIDNDYEQVIHGKKNS